MTVIVDTSKSPYAKLFPLPIENIKIKDKFWSPRLRLLQEKILPSQYELLEETGHIDNFRRAAGKTKGPFQGQYYYDSDVYKWIEAAALSLAYDKNKLLLRLLERLISEIIQAQEPNGYLNTYFVFEKKKARWSNLRDMHELYCAGHLFQAAIAYYRSVKKHDLLSSAIRFADHIYKVFRSGTHQGVPGHPGIEMGLIELYRVTHDRRYLDLAKSFIDQRGKGLIGGTTYHIDHRPFRELQEICGHAVRALYLNCGATDLFAETGEEALISTLKRLWKDMIEKKLYITGGVGARHEGESFGDAYELPNLRAYAETCAAIANIMWSWRMLLTTGFEEFTDILELALYNGALAGISLDGTKYFYVNPLSDSGKHRRQPWFECACCPTNIIRLLASLPGYIYSLSPRGIWVHLYVASEVDLYLNKIPLTLKMTTDYPWDGEISIILEPQTDICFSLFLRIPGWCSDVTVYVNDQQVTDVEPGSYLELRRVWRRGDTVRIHLYMPVQIIASHPWVESNYGKVALKRGPLIYCLEQVDNPCCHIWNIKLSPQSTFVTKFTKDLLGGIVTLKGRGFCQNIENWYGRLYSSTSMMSGKEKPIDVVAIPYYAWANRNPGPMSVWVPLTISKENI